MAHPLILIIFGTYATEHVKMHVSTFNGRTGKYRLVLYNVHLPKTWIYIKNSY